LKSIAMMRAFILLVSVIQLSPGYAIDKCPATVLIGKNIQKDLSTLQDLKKINALYENTVHMQKRLINGEELGDINGILVEVQRDLTVLEDENNDYTKMFHYSIGGIIISKILLEIMQRKKYPTRFYFLDRSKTHYGLMAAGAVLLSATIWGYLKTEELEQNILGLRPIFTRLNNMLSLAQQIANYSEYISAKELYSEALVAEVIAQGLGKLKDGKLVCHP